MVILYHELLMQRGRLQIAVHNAHRTADLRSQHLAGVRAHPCPAVSRFRGRKYYATWSLGSSQEEGSMNQLRDFVTGDSIEFQCWKKAGRICRRNRPCPRFWLQHNFWLQYNPLAHLVQEFKVSAH